jgi:hypothetical protein
MAYILPNNNNSKLTIDKSFYDTGIDTAKVRSALGLGTNQELKLGTTTPSSNVAGVSNTTPNTIVNKPVVSQSPLTAKTLASTNTGYTDNTKAPTINTNTSDIQTQAASIEAKIKDLQTQLDASVKSGEVVKGGTSETPTTPTEPSIWDKLLGKVDETKNEITQSNADMASQINNIYSQWGLTPENFNKLKDLSVQIGDVNKQIADLDTREQQALENVTNVPGQDLAYMSGEQKRISTAYSIQRSGLAAKASAMASTASALQGDWDTAYQMASQYVDNATAVQKNNVDTIKWGMEQYSDIIQAMSKEEQANLQATLDYETSLLKQQQDDNWKQMDYDLKKQGLNLDISKYNLDVAKTLGMTGGYTPGTVVTPGNEQATLKSIVSALPVGQQEGAYSTFQVFKNGKELLDLLDKGVNTGLVSGTIGKIGQAIGTTGTDYNRFAALSAEMSAAFIKAMTGVQMSDKERQYYLKALPSVTKPESVNKDNIKSLMEFLQNKYELQLGIKFSDFPNEIINVKSSSTGSTGSTGGTTSSGLTYTIIP